MSYLVVESFIRSKFGDPRRCEDVLHISDHFVAVIDGATAKNPGLFEGGTPGKAIAEAVNAAIHGLSPDCDMQTGLRVINERIRSDPLLKPLRRTKRQGRDLPSAALALLSKRRDEIWIVGDCSIAIDGQIEKFGKRIDAVNSAFRSAVNRIELLKGKSVSDLRAHDFGRNAIMGVLKWQTLFQNNPEAGDFAYGMLDGSDECIGFAQVRDVSKASVVALASDGYPFLEPTLAGSEEALKRLLEGDPLLVFDIQQTKGLAAAQESFDDRTYVRLERR